MNFKKCFKFLKRWNLFQKKAQDKDKRGKKNVQLEATEEGEEFPLDQKIVSPQEEEAIEKKSIQDAVVVDLVDSSVDKLHTEVQIKAEEGNNIVTSDENSELNNNSLIQKVEGEIEPTNETATGPTEEKVAMDNDSEEGMEDDAAEQNDDTKVRAEEVAMDNDSEDGVEDNAEKKDDMRGRAEEKVAMDNDSEEGVEDVAEQKDDFKGRAEEEEADEHEMERDAVVDLVNSSVDKLQTEVQIKAEEGDNISDKNSELKNNSVIQKVEGEIESTNETATGPTEEKVTVENMGEEAVVDDKEQKDDLTGRTEELSEQLVVKTNENTDLLEKLAEMEKQLKELKNERQVKEKETSAEYDRMAKKIDIVKTKNRMLRLNMMEMGKKMELTEEKLQETVKLSSASMSMLSSAMENFKKDWNESKKN